MFNRILSLLLVLIAAPSGVAQQFGTGIYPGTNCSSPMQIGRGAVNGEDEISNLRGHLADRNARLAVLRQRQSILQKYIDRDKSDMGQVLTSGAIRAVEEHRRFHDDPDSYQTDCGAVVSSGGQDFDAELPGEPRVAVAADRNLRPPPAEFCYKGKDRVHNTWRCFAGKGGIVSGTICDYYIPGVAKTRDPNRRDACHDGIRDFYDQMDAKEMIERDIAQLDAEAKGFERKLVRIHYEITEGTYCPTCNAQRRGYARESTGGDSIGQLVAPFAMMAVALIAGGNRRPAQPQFGGPGYPATPYAANVPGYPMVGPGNQYGALPGSMGAGSFNCQGSNPLAMGNPLASPAVQPVFGGTSPFNNPYAIPQFASGFNPGAGPGWGFPQYGNGVPAYRDPFGAAGLMASPLAVNPFAPSPFAANPYAQGTFAQSPFGVQPYGQFNPFAANPYAQYSPYGPFNPNGVPGVLPYPGAAGFNPYDPYGSNAFLGAQGYNPFAPNPYAQYNPYGAPGVLPFPGAQTPYGGFGYPGYGVQAGGLGGIPNYGYNTPWGAPLGSPTGNFFSQVERMNTQMQMIQSGPYYGGGTPLSAPAVLPYPGSNLSSPIYNTPGGPLNPVPVRTATPSIH